MALTWNRVHLIAAREALEAHRDLHTDLSRRIDPFAALARTGVVVIRRPLGRLTGAYIAANPADGSAPGVLIHSGQPMSRQRYTAAHELCHHRRDRATIFDDDTEWLSRGEDRQSDRERIAEAFAAWFLMPLQYVTEVIRSLGLAVDRLEAAQAYALSLDLGTSYEATLHHLVDLNLLHTAQRDRLLRVRPRAIKEALVSPDTIEDVRRNVWLVKAPQERRLLHPLEGDGVVVVVPETPSSGYLWHPTLIPDGLTLVRDYFTSDEEKTLGGHGQHRFYFRVDGIPLADVAAELVTRDLRMEMRRPWQRSDAAESVNIAIQAEPQPQPGIAQPGQLVEAVGA